MKKYFFASIVLAVILVAAGSFDWPDRTYKHAKLSFGGFTFDVRVSDTEKLRERGLSGLSGLPKNQAMLFVFPKPGIYGFWMKDMLFAIDILWLDRDFKIISFEKNISPETFPKVFYPERPSQYVVELATGALPESTFKSGGQFLVSGGK